jgi:branched-chain amino acid transport system ATP-binding protein
MNELLKVTGLSAGYGGKAVVHDCSLSVGEGKMVGVVGRNGAGKTTLVSAISGRIKLFSGDVVFDGRSVSRLPCFRRSRLGIAHVPQGREVMEKMTVDENLRLAEPPGKDGDERERIFKLFPVLQERLRQQAGTLSGGEQQMLAIARAVVSKCRLLILDEPSLGLAPKVVKSVFDDVRALREQMDLTVILVEQQARWIWEEGLVDHVYVLDNGTISASGTPAELEEGFFEKSYLGLT